MNTKINLAESIVQKALAHGYENCGIIGIKDVVGYADKLDKRIEQTPQDRGGLNEFYRFANLQTTYPWAKSIIVCVYRYGKYSVPVNLEGLIGKHYLFDGRKDEKSPDYKASVKFEEYLHSIGLRSQTERKFGITALRWAAYQAGLGIIRNNNFFYTSGGSWVSLEAWLIDEELVWKQECTLKPCPPNCGRCITACPTKSLSEPYVMSLSSCVSYLSTFGGDDLINNPNSGNMGQWVFGCDTCQDVCPFNKGKWKSEDTFPGLNELAEHITLEKTIRLDYDFLINTIYPKFWYISHERMWKWKTNALNAMRNSGDSCYEDTIKEALNDQSEQVREMAAWVLDESKRQTARPIKKATL